MENREGGDDQGSGWMQVKKKHRGNLKFSLHGWVGGVSARLGSGNIFNQSSVGAKQEDDKFGRRTSKAIVGNIKNDTANVSSSVSNEDNMVQYLDKSVVSESNKSLESPSTVDLDVGDSNIRIGSNENSRMHGQSIFPKIKWGDLDDGIFQSSNNGVSHIKFDEMQTLTPDTGSPCAPSFDPKNHNLIKTSVEEYHFIPDYNPPSNESAEECILLVNELVATSAAEDQTCQVSSELVLRKELAFKHAEVCDMSLEDIKEQVSDLQNTKQGSSSCSEINERIKAKLDEKFNSFCKSILEEHAQDSIVNPINQCETSCDEVSKESVVNQISRFVAISEGCELTSPDLLQQGSPSCSTFSSLKDPEKDVCSESLPVNKPLNSADADVTGESKERFRERLWCFLFENINRAVDELYLLCELECDLEQTKEAVLVLEEAASDFKELYSRVEEFEKMKKSSSNSVDGPSFTMKSEHRRPHALSWEVRRMTSSPRRAEILSSSLEAFRKIQEERANACAIDAGKLDSVVSNIYSDAKSKEGCSGRKGLKNETRKPVQKSRKQSSAFEPSQGSSTKANAESDKTVSLASRVSIKETSSSSCAVKLPVKEISYKCKKDKLSMENAVEKNNRLVDQLQQEKQNGNTWRSLDAWKEKRNWEDVLASPHRASTRFSHSPGMSRKSAERARILHDKLMSPEKKKKSALDLKKEAEEKHARAMRIRSELENERVQKLQRTSEKLNRVNEWQAIRSMKLREVMHARHQRSESRHEAFLAQVVRRAGDESSKVNEVRFITSLNEENKKLMLRQKLHDSELRRAEKLHVLKIKQKEDMAREEAVLERRKLIEAEKLQRLAETQRRKEEAQVRREEERKASSAAREAKAIEQMRRKEIRAKAQQEEAELLAQKLAERLNESEQRRKFYLEQIRERASMDFRDQTSPLLRRSVNRDGQGKSMVTGNGEDSQANSTLDPEGSTTGTSNLALQQALKRRTKRIRQKLMSQKYEFPEPAAGSENAGIGYRTAVATARGKIGRWIQELQKLRQARKDGASSFGLITCEIIKFVEGKEAELHGARQAGLLDFIASALPASHSPKPEAIQVTIYLLRLLKIVLSIPANRSYFLAQNLLPPIIPMLAAALENYIKIAASSNLPSAINLTLNKTPTQSLELTSEVLDGFLWTVAAVINHSSSDEREIQMRDGLVELVIAYQVIHRLRDLFALYDRPPVEGSSFPASIILGIDLLSVLTSRFRNLSVIDLRSLPREGGIRNENHYDTEDLTDSLSFSYNGDDKLPLSATNGSLVLPLPNVPEDRPLQGMETQQNGVLLCIDKISDSIESSKSKTRTSDTGDETLDIPSDDFYSSQKDFKKLVDICCTSDSGFKQPVPFLLSAISDTGLVCLPSMLTAVLLQANQRLSADQASYMLPSNFQEVATGVLKVLNNIALIDITSIQSILAKPDLKMEFFHLTSFLLSYCTSNWRVATDQIGLLLLESLSLLGYFALLHNENQAVLRWGKTPTILNKVCDLPFVFFSDPELMPILGGTLIAACYGCELNKDVILQELSTDMILSLLSTCKSSLPAVRSFEFQHDPHTDVSSDSFQLGPESRKFQVNASYKAHRNNQRSTKQKGGSSISSSRTTKLRNQKLKPVEDACLKNNQFSSENATMMLYTRLSRSLIDKAEQFFSSEMNGLTEEN